MDRRFWLMYLHPIETKWWEEYGFKNLREAFEYYLLKKQIIGLDAGWNFEEKDTPEIKEWIKERIRFYRRFCLEMKQGDVVVFCKNVDGEYLEAILLIKDNYIFHHEKPIAYKEVVYNNEKFDVSNFDRKGITKKLWQKYGVLGDKDIDFLEYPYDSKVWFDLIRRVKVIWYSRGKECKICHSNRQTLTEISSREIIIKILKLIKEHEREDILNLLKNQKQIILYGPPGTGKTYLAKEIAACMLGLEPHSREFRERKFKPGSNQDGAWEIVQFHPSYNYEDFVRGIKVTASSGALNYLEEDKIFAKMCEEADKNREKPFILIIDEINRANLASVLGELIYALEYRDEEVYLPYGKDPLKIPPNLYIIGTMNTADRSIGYIDYAVRRRFAFVQVLPREEVITSYYHEKGQDKLGKMALQLFKAVEKLFDKEGCLSPDSHKEDVQIGHSYFLAENKEELAFKFAYQVWPLLKEYCKDGVLQCEACEIKFPFEVKGILEHSPNEIFEKVVDFSDSEEEISRSSDTYEEEATEA